MKSLKNLPRIFFAFPVLLAFLLVLSGCGQKPTGNNLNGANPAPAGARGSRMPDFGQPKRQADIRGIVKSITGNEATILLVELPGGRGNAAGSSSTTPDGASSSSPAPVVSLNIGGNVGAGGGQGGRQGGGGGFGGGGGRQGGGQGGAPVDRAAMLARLKAMSTGEATVTIPVGIQMLKTAVDPSTKQRTAVEATLADITADKTITIWLNSGVADKKVAEFVLIN